MSDAPHGKIARDRHLYVQNRGKFTPDDMLPYAGQWPGWNTDGSRIVVHDADLDEAFRQLEGLGSTTDDVIFDRIPPGGEPECIL